MKAGPFAPVEAFLAWFDTLDLSYRTRITLFMSGSVPVLNDALEDELSAENAETKLREWLRAPISREIELVARIGALKSVIEVSLIVPIRSADAQAFASADLALKVIGSKAKNNGEDLALWKMVEKFKPQSDDRDAVFCLSWLDLVDADGVLSDRSLYSWALKAQGRRSPVLPPDADV